jgi:hypothetical protein
VRVLVIAMLREHERTQTYSHTQPGDLSLMRTLESSDISVRPLVEARIDAMPNLIIARPSRADGLC